jgi:Icc-related predicted phosphoesterase
MDDEEFGRRLEALGEVDVICTHVGPSLPEAVFDVVAGRPQNGSAALLRYIEEVQPLYAYHGHVHQPAQRELRVGRTRIINVAYYKRDRYVHTHA